MEQCSEAFVEMLHLMSFVCFIRSTYRIINTVQKRAKILDDFNFYCGTFRNIVNKSMNAKPPNILVYTGDNCSRKFKSIEENLSRCLKSDRYIVYHLLPSEIKEHPWMENSLLLVVSSAVVDISTALLFEFYCKNYGNVLFVCSKFNSTFMGTTCSETQLEDCLIQTSYNDFGDFYIFRGKYLYSDGTILFKDKNKNPLIWKKVFDKNVLIISEVYLVNDPDISLPSSYNSENQYVLLKHILNKEFELAIKSDDFSPELSPGYFLSDDGNEMVRIIKNLKIGDISSSKHVFHQFNFNHMAKQITLPVYFYNQDSCAPLNFDRNIYFPNLNTEVYGHSVVYFPVITTTMEVAPQLSDYEGIVVVANRQISGRARGTNKWISPSGCAMFTLHFTIHLSSCLGKKLTLLQHIASLAVVHGIRSQKIYKELDLKIKWPNDIYHGKVKIGGLIVTSVLQKDLAHIYIGWGINVSNSCPTSCINDAIDFYNTENSCSLPHLHVEEIIAFTLSQMEFFVKDFMNCGSEKFLTYYYSYWMHSNNEVTLKHLNQQGIVIGIDDFGFLKVKTDEGKIVVFQPDGNRYDIMKNLIYSK